MTFADVLMWMAGASWLMTAIMAISQMRSGEYALLKYLGAVGHPHFRERLPRE